MTASATQGFPESASKVDSTPASSRIFRIFLGTSSDSKIFSVAEAPGAAAIARNAATRCGGRREGTEWRSGGRPVRHPRGQGAFFLRAARLGPVLHHSHQRDAGGAGD